MLGHLSYVVKDGEFSPSDTVAKTTSLSALHSPFATGALESFSSGQRSQRSLLSPRAGVKDLPSVLDA